MTITQLQRPQLILIPCIFLMLLIYSSGIKAQHSETDKHDSEIKSATVFKNGAQVTRRASVNLESGRQTLLFSGLPDHLNENEVQVEAKGNLNLLSVQYSTNYLKTRPEGKNVADLKGRLDNAKEKKEDLTTEKSVLEDEAAMLKENRSIGGSENGIETEQLKSAVAYYRSRMMENAKQQLEIKREVNILEDTIQKIQNQLNQLQDQDKQPVGEVEVVVETQQPARATFEISYYHGNASWQPLYDLRVQDVDQPVDLVYKAKVSQSTGEDWNNVNLTLSTGNPRESGTKPELNPWYIPYQNIVEVADDEAIYGARAPDNEAANKVELNMKRTSETARSPDVNSFENITSTNFQISQKYTIPSTGDQQKEVVIGNHELDGEYRYYVAPRLDQDVFLTTRITGWADMNLLPGSANIFFKNTYQGQTRLNPGITEDTLTVSLGRDKNIQVERNQLKDFQERTFLGSNKRTTVGWEINIRNSKNVPINLVVKEQLPVSRNEDYSVEPIDLNGAKHNKITGMLTWKLELDANANKKITYKYSVKYPKEGSFNPR